MNSNFSDFPLFSHLCEVNPGKDESQIGAEIDEMLDLKVKKIKPKFIASIFKTEQRKKQMQKRKKLLMEKRLSQNQSKTDRRYSASVNRKQNENNGDNSIQRTNSFFYSEAEDAIETKKEDQNKAKASYFKQEYQNGNEPQQVSQAQESSEALINPNKFFMNKDYNVDFKFKNGDRYQGGFRDHCFQGNGKFIFQDGKIIQGIWRGGQIQGKAKVIYPNGDIYVGGYKRMKKNGFGYLIYQNGGRYTGQFDDGKIMGYGVYELDGKNYEGYWENGHLLNPKDDTNQNNQQT